MTAIPPEVPAEFVQLLEAMPASERDKIIAQYNVDKGKRTNLDNAAATLRGWADDIRNSPAATTQNIVNQFQQLKDRQAIFYDRFADLLDTRRSG